MTKHEDPLPQALREGKSFTWTEPDGGDLASMRLAIKHGQTLTMSPIADPSEIQVGDIVFLRWHKGYMCHLVGEIKGDQYLIMNSLGKVNGWVSIQDILGRVTNVIEPEPRPGVPEQIDQLELAYRDLLQKEQPPEDEARLLMSIVEDLRWYAGRIGSERWTTMPRLNKWSFEQNLWRLIKRTRQASVQAQSPIRYAIDLGKQCVGLASQIIALFENHEES